MVKNLELILKTFLVTTLLVGVVNELKPKNEYIRELSKLGCMILLTPLVGAEEYRRHKTY